MEGMGDNEETRRSKGRPQSYGAPHYASTQAYINEISTMALSLSASLDSAFGIDNSLDGLAKTVEHKCVSPRALIV